MPFGSIFKKKSNKDKSTLPQQKEKEKSRELDLLEDTPSVFYIDTKPAYSGVNQVNKVRFKQPVRIRTSESLSKDPAYINRLFGTYDRQTHVVMPNQPEKNLPKDITRESLKRLSLDPAYVNRLLGIENRAHGVTFKQPDKNTSEDSKKVSLDQDNRHRKKSSRNISEDAGNTKRSSEQDNRHRKKSSQNVSEEVQQSLNKTKQSLEQENKYRKRSSRIESEDKGQHSLVKTKGSLGQENRYGKKSLRNVSGDEVQQSLDQQNKSKINSNLVRKTTPNIVYTANIPETSFQCNPTLLNKPLPHEICNDQPRMRSIVYREVSNDNCSINLEKSRNVAFTPIEYSVPSTSEHEELSYSIMDVTECPAQQTRRVTIQDPIDGPETFDAARDVETVPGMKTVLRLRPRSFSAAKKRESVKLMVFRADHQFENPMSLGKFFHKLPFKAPAKLNPVMVTDDGKILKPIEGNKVRSSLTQGQQGNIVRVPVADINSVCSALRKSRGSRASENYARTSFEARQSVLSRKSVVGQTCAMDTDTGCSIVEQNKLECLLNPEENSQLNSQQLSSPTYKDSILKDSTMYQQQSTVYAAEMPEDKFPRNNVRNEPKIDTMEERFFETEEKSSKDYCGLTFRDSEIVKCLQKKDGKVCSTQQTDGDIAEMVSFAQQTEDMDFLCNPTEGMSNVSPDQDTNPRWKIVIKK